MVRMVSWSGWCCGQSGIMVRMVSWSGWYPDQNDVMVRVVSWSGWCRGQNGVMVRVVSWSCVQVSPHWPHQQHLCTQGRAGRTGRNSRLFVFVLLLFAEAVGYLFLFCCCLQKL